MMKCFERLLKDHIVSRLPPLFDPFQFADRQNRSTQDAISSVLHLSLAHLEEKNTHVRMLFLDFSSAFNTIIPQHLVGKLEHLGFNTPLRNWLLDFLTNRPQSVRVGQNTSDVITLSTGSPQGCVLSPLLFTLNDTRLRPQVHHQSHREVRRRHNGGGAHQRQQRPGLQRGGGAAGGLVQRQQPDPECGEDEGDHRRLQEKPASPRSTDHQQLSCGGGQQHQIPGGPHHRRPHLDYEHYGTDQEGTEALVLPAEDEESPPAPTDHEDVLQEHHREHSDKLTLCVVWRLHRLRLEEREESGEDSREDHRGSSSLHSGHFISALHVPCP
nr:uncharacterized protein LOC125992631 [Syngnathus scovelli]XP_049617695.1 uncharacterized protein LOC125992631 [Syngnathus scovelli]